MQVGDHPMAGFKAIIKSGHPPTLIASFLYFDFCFAVWVLNGAMAPFLSEAFKLSPAQTGLMISLPILAGALMRFPLGVVSLYIGRKNAALIEMSLLMVAMVFGYVFVDTYDMALAMGVLLGIAGASFGVALSLGSGWFPAEHKGLAMGIAGAGNSGTALATLFAPVIASRYGYHTAYAVAGFAMLLPFVVMLVFAKEPPDVEHQTVLVQIRCLWDADGWTFNLVYIITFGGFIGLAAFLPTFFYNSFGMTKVQAGIYATLATFMGSATRVVGGFAADRLGGIVTLAVVFLGVIAMFFSLTTSPSLTITVILFMSCFACLGAGNGALFQLVPLRWPYSTAVVGSMVGEIGALGGSILPNVMGLSKQYTGSFALGFVIYACIAGTVLAALMFVSRFWVGKWIGKGGKALGTSPVLAPGVGADGSIAVY